MPLTDTKAMNATLPWHIGGTFNPDTDQRVNIWGPTPEGAQSGELIAYNIKPGNAEIILLAVHAHADLLEALKWAERQLRALVAEADGYGVFIPGTRTELAGFGAGLERIRAAIATTEGQQS